MYLASDPRSALAPADAGKAPMPDSFAAADLGLFYETAPQEDGPAGKTWYVRGQNILIAYTDATDGGVLERPDQVDEYAVLIPRADTRVTITAGEETKTVEGNALAFVPPGASRIAVSGGGPIVRLFTTRSADLAQKCPNADAYRERRANIPAFEAWPTPKDGFRIRAYSLDVPPQPGRFGRIWRCTTIMVNMLDPQQGPRDVTKLSPHHHDDFEQCSLALEGSFIHHLRWPWTPNLNAWREDEHPHVGSPSVTIIPPPAIHTTRGMEPGVNQLVDIFSPPRRDFSEKPGWVLNADDYPMPA
jgi:hypothetical protein